MFLVMEVAGDCNSFCDLIGKRDVCDGKSRRFAIAMFAALGQDRAKTHHVRNHLHKASLGLSPALHCIRLLLQMGLARALLLTVEAVGSSC